MPRSRWSRTGSRSSASAEPALTQPEAGRPQAAIEWFERTLRRTPNRSRALIGLARARRNAGDTAGSRKAYEQFLRNWKGADPGLPELKEARAAVGK